MKVKSSQIYLVFFCVHSHWRRNIFLFFLYSLSWIFHFYKIVLNFFLNVLVRSHQQISNLFQNYVTVRSNIFSILQIILLIFYILYATENFLALLFSMLFSTSVIQTWIEHFPLYFSLYLSHIHYWIFVGDSSEPHEPLRFFCPDSF